MAKQNLKQHRAAWSDKDVATLTKMAVTVPARMIADALGRTANAVRRKAGLIGLSLGGSKRSPGEDWTEDS